MQQRIHEHNHTWKTLSIHGRILLVAEPGRFLPLKNPISSSTFLQRSQSQYLFRVDYFVPSQRYAILKTSEVSDKHSDSNKLAKFIL